MMLIYTTANASNQISNSITISFSEALFFLIYFSIRNMIPIMTHMP